MAAKILARDNLFLDSSFAIALAVPRDQNHARAVALADDITMQQARLVTTWAILLEIGNALAKPAHRDAGRRLLESLENDPTVEVIPLTETLFQKGRQLFADRADKEWGLTDCISFIAMQERNLTKALTADQHFIQAGFEILL